MTHEELLAKINHQADVWDEPMAKALRAIVELHKPETIDGEVICQAHGITNWGGIGVPYPCGTIQTIEKELA